MYSGSGLKAGLIRTGIFLSGLKTSEPRAIVVHTVSVVDTQTVSVCVTTADKSESSHRPVSQHEAAQGETVTAVVFLQIGSI